MFYTGSSSLAALSSWRIIQGFSAGGAKPLLVLKDELAGLKVRGAELLSKAPVHVCVSSEKGHFTEKLGQASCQHRSESN